MRRARLLLRRRWPPTAPPQVRVPDPTPGAPPTSGHWFCHDFQARLDPSGYKENRLRDPLEDPQNPHFFSTMTVRCARLNRGYQNVRITCFLSLRLGHLPKLRPFFKAEDFRSRARARARARALWSVLYSVLFLFIPFDFFYSFSLFSFLFIYFHLFPLPFIPVYSFPFLLLGFIPFYSFPFLSFMSNPFYSLSFLFLLFPIHFCSFPFLLFISYSLCVCIHFHYFYIFSFVLYFTKSYHFHYLL